MGYFGNYFLLARKLRHAKKEHSPVNKNGIARSAAGMRPSATKKAVFIDVKTNIMANTVNKMVFFINSTF